MEDIPNLDVCFVPSIPSDSDREYLQRIGWVWCVCPHVSVCYTSIDDSHAWREAAKMRGCSECEYCPNKRTRNEEHI